MTVAFEVNLQGGASSMPANVQTVKFPGGYSPDDQIYHWDLFNRNFDNSKLQYPGSVPVIECGTYRGVRNGPSGGLEGGTSGTSDSGSSNSGSGNVATSAAGNSGPASTSAAAAGPSEVAAIATGEGESTENSDSYDETPISSTGGNTVDSGSVTSPAATAASDSGSASAPVGSE